MVYFLQVYDVLGLYLCYYNDLYNAMASTNHIEFK